MANRISFNVNGKARKASKPRVKKNTLARKLSYAVGTVGVSVLGLSVAHCTESITLLTGSHWTLAGLLAVGIDAGMVSSELAELVGKGEQVKKWARAYTIIAVLLSILLNAYAFGLHAASGMQWASWTLGAVVPILVYILGRVAGYLYQE